MRIVFSAHALKRCKERGLNPMLVVRDIESELPTFQATAKWTFRRGTRNQYTAVMASANDVVTVITLYFDFKVIRKHKKKTHAK